MELPKTMPDGSIPSPDGFVPDKAVFDYDKQRDEITLTAIKLILKVFAADAEHMVHPVNTDHMSVVESEAKVAEHMLEAIIDAKVPDAEMKYLAESIQSKIYRLFQVISEQKAQFEKELLARAIGANDPGTGLLSREQATFGDLLTALTAKRKEQEPDGISRYFAQRKDEE